MGQILYSASDPENHVAAIAASIPANARLIRIDGHSGVGKSRFAKALASFLPATRIDVDSFIDRHVPGRAYLPKIMVPSLHAATRGALDAGRVVLYGLWLSQLLPEEQFGSGYRICVISEPIGRNDGYRDEIRRRQQFRTGAYFRLHRLEKRADLLLTVPHENLFEQ